MGLTLLAVLVAASQVKALQIVSYGKKVKILVGHLGRSHWKINKG